jgi:hypothetical protein
MFSILLMAVGLTTSFAAPRPAAPAASAGTAVSAELPLVRCPTTYGIAPAPGSVVLPATRRVTVPAAMAARLAVYTDNRGFMEVVAPRGWNCAAEYGADGSGGVTVYPHGQKPHWYGSGSLAADSTVSVVTGGETYSYGPVLDGACRLSPAAATALSGAGFGPCPVRPEAERVTRISASVVDFTDPPGTAGDGAPSGGRYPARGVMTYHHGPDGYDSWSETCTLPPADQAACPAIIADFTSRYSSR